MLRFNLWMLMDYPIKGAQLVNCLDKDRVDKKIKFGDMIISICIFFSKRFKANFFLAQISRFRGIFGLCLTFI